MSSLFRPRLAAAAFVVALVAFPQQSRAQQYLIGAEGAVSSGMEGGGGEPMRRTRTRIRLGADLRIDESPDDIFEFGALAEIEPQSAFGGDLRYGRMIGEHFLIDAGFIGILAPSSLYGACAGLTYRLSISKSSQVIFGPEADFFFLGTDLPDNVMLWQLRFEAGFRVDL